jgi:hypothetical protein
MQVARRSFFCLPAFLHAPHPASMLAYMYVYLLACLHACMVRACVCGACAHAYLCVHACVCACVCACVWVCGWTCVRAGGRVGKEHKVVETKATASCDRPGFLRPPRPRVGREERQAVAATPHHRDLLAELRRVRHDPTTQRFMIMTIPKSRGTREPECAQTVTS